MKLHGPPHIIWGPRPNGKGIGSEALALLRQNKCYSEGGYGGPADPPFKTGYKPSAVSHKGNTALAKMHPSTRFQQAKEVSV